MPRSIDHLVFALKDLQKGKQFFTQLGFTSAPLGIHPFGTGNHNVFFDQSFIELLGILDENKIVPHQPEQFSFSAFNQNFLQEKEGVSMIVIQTKDAKADYHRLTAAGLSCSTPFHFSRGNQLADGSIVEVGFTTSFFQSDLLPKLAFFVCQHHHPEYIWQTAYQQHENSSCTIESIHLVVDFPKKILPFMQLVFDSDSVEKTASGFQLYTKNESINIISNDHYKQTNHSSERVRIPFISTIKIKVKNLEKSKDIFVQSKIIFQEKRQSLFIDSSNAFGVNLEFV